MFEKALIALAVLYFSVGLCGVLWVGTYVHTRGGPLRSARGLAILLLLFAAWPFYLLVEHARVTAERERLAEEELHQSWVRLSEELARRRAARRDFEPWDDNLSD